MINESNISIDSVNGSETEYIIRDGLGITIGRAYIIDFSSESRYCCLRIRFYKAGNSSSEYLKTMLNLFLISLFKKSGIHKVNILADEEIITTPFTSLGFELEGIITESYLFNNVYKDELIFGISEDEFQSADKQRQLELKGKNVALKILTPENAEDVADYYKRNREHLKPFEPLREEFFFTLEAQRKVLTEGYKQFLNGTSVSMGIFKDDRFIGKIRISNIVIGTFKSATIGYSIDKEMQGKGYMKEAVNLTVQYAFDEMGLHRIEASALVDNIKSQRVLLGCGFKKLGVNEKYLYINGEWRDHITFYKVQD